MLMQRGSASGEVFLRAWVRRLLIVGAVVAAAGSAGATRHGSGVIDPGAVWLDNRGKEIQAHGGGILHQGRTYYWFGEDRSQGNDPDKRYVACYSSTDLAHWRFRG